jgi:hypothetical protein
MEGIKDALLDFLTRKASKASLIPSISFIPNSNQLFIKQYFLNEKFFTPFLRIFSDCTDVGANKLFD